MGEALYGAAAGNARLRAYAPVGGHEELLRKGRRYAELWNLQTVGSERGAA